MNKITVHLNSPDRLTEALEYLAKIELNGMYSMTLNKLPHAYTLQQQKAIHVYMRLLSEALNDGGWTIQQVLAQAVDRDWDLISAKNNLWRPIQVAMFDKESTTQLDRDEVVKVYEILNRHTSNIFGIGMNFPNRKDFEAKQ